MKNNGKLFIALFVLAMGLFFEVIKSARHRQLTGDKITASELADMDLRPYSRNDLEADQIAARHQRFRMGKVAGMMKSGGLKAENYTFDGSKAKDTKNKKDKKKKKKKKKDDKKKKTVKKVKPPAGHLDAQVEDSDNDALPAETATAAAGAVSSPAVENGNELPVGYEQWAREVLLNPDFSATSKLIQYYQNGLVDDTIFYLLVNEMLADPRIEMNEMGIKAATATPSPASFLALARFMESNPQGSQGRNLAYSQMHSTYSHLSNVRKLESVLSNSDSSFAVILALQFVGESASRHLKPTSQTPPATPGENQPDGQASESSIKKNGKYFTSLYAIMMRLMNDAGDQRVVQAAAQAVNTLEPLMSQQMVSQL